MAVLQPASHGRAREKEVMDMDRAQLLELFKKTASEIAEKDFADVGEDSVIASMGVDSLAMLEVVGEMERELTIQVPDDQLVGLETVRQLLDMLEKRITA
ncbi:MAG: acyl carrier protein [Deltaproteobacteria bacterium]|nr:acyl carrier protein [Deltaproteobacteria bacterium]